MISSDKILGVFVDNNLTWTDHIKYLTKKLHQVFGSYQKLKSSYPRIIEFNFISRTYNRILTSAILYGAVHLRAINLRYSDCKNEPVK